MNPELLRGNLDLILLTILERGPLYGFAIIQAAKERTGGYFDFKEGQPLPGAAPSGAGRSARRAARRDGAQRQAAQVLRPDRRRAADIEGQTHRVRRLHRGRAAPGRSMTKTASDTAAPTSPAVHAYLRRATWGLPRERQQELWDELEEHLLTRAEQFQAARRVPERSPCPCARGAGFARPRERRNDPGVSDAQSTDDCRRRRPRPERRAVRGSGWK